MCSTWGRGSSLIGATSPGRRAKKRPFVRCFTAGKPNWGYQLRFGLFPISAGDFRLIAKAMGAVR
jgi:hypothetical protein